MKENKASASAAALAIVPNEESMMYVTIPAQTQIRNLVDVKN